MEATSPLHFGALLRKFRLDAGFTQQELAERAKLSVEAISTLERGARTRPHRETVVLLGRALGLSPEREALLESAGGIAHPPRRREHGQFPIASLLTVVRSDAQATSKHNLPRQLTSFVGRRREIDEITALLRNYPLVTIVGTGGVGKTCVAVHVGSDVLRDYTDGVWLVDLAPLTDQTLMTSSILTTLQLPSHPGSALDAIVAYLKARRALLILDNCEHVIAQARNVAATLVRSCPHVGILSTSREALVVAGEQAYRLPSLGVPLDSQVSARDALLCDSVSLFVDRASTVNASFVLTDENAPDVANICRRLDGIPLAIELAAARASVLAPGQIAQRLDDRFRLLTSKNAYVVSRQQTMRALIDWSYDLLTPREQSFFESLSVFAGGCAIDEISAVCTADGEDEIDIVDLLASLVSKSLLVAELAGGEQRYRFLESFRQYAQEKLIAGGTHEKLARRHALVYLDLAEGFERAWDATPERDWLRRTTLELENWRAVMEWALGKHGDVVVGQRLASLRTVVSSQINQVERRHWIRASLEMVNNLTPRELVARLEHADADSASKFGESKVSLAAAERALLLYREVGDVLGVAQVQILAGGSLALLGRPSEAEPLLQAALEVARMLDNRRLTANVLQKIGWARIEDGDFAGARAYLTEAVELANLLGAESFSARVMLELADVEFRSGNPEMALRLTVELLAGDRMPNASGILASEIINTARINIASYLIALGRYDEARVHANKALDLARELGLATSVAFSLKLLALATLLRAQDNGFRTLVEYANAVAQLFGYVDAKRATLGIEDDGLAQQYERALDMIRDSISNDGLVKMMAAGGRMTEDEAIGRAGAIR